MHLAVARLPGQVHEGEIAGAFDGSIGVELAFSGLDLGSMWK